MQGFIQLQGMYTRLVHKRFQLNEICDAVSLNETKRARVNQQHDLAAKRLDALIDQKKPDPLMPLIQQHIEGHLAETKLLLEEYSHLLDQRTRVQFEAIELITTELGGASEINTNILLAARRDLNLPIDESWYRKFTKEGELTAKQLTQEFVRDLKAKAIPPDNEAK